MAHTTRSGVVIRYIETAASTGSRSRERPAENWHGLCPSNRHFRCDYDIASVLPIKTESIATFDLKSQSLSNLKRVSQDPDQIDCALTRSYATVCEFDSARVAEGIIELSGVDSLHRNYARSFNGVWTMKAADETRLQHPSLANASGSRSIVVPTTRVERGRSLRSSRRRRQTVGRFPELG